MPRFEDTSLTEDIWFIMTSHGYARNIYVILKYVFYTVLCPFFEIFCLLSLSFIHRLIVLLKDFRCLLHSGKVNLDVNIDDHFSYRFFYYPMHESSISFSKPYIGNLIILHEIKAKMLSSVGCWLALCLLKDFLLRITKYLALCMIWWDWF